VHRCPLALLRESGWWNEFLNAFWALENYNTWPEGPRLGDQSPTFIEAARIFKGWRDDWIRKRGKRDNG